MTVIDEINRERIRQHLIEGWTDDHDDEHACEELATAAACYACPDIVDTADPSPLWPWDLESWNPKSRRQDLIRAAALIVAEIERLDRRPEGGEEI